MVNNNSKGEQIVEQSERKVEKLTQRDIDRELIKEKYRTFAGSSTKPENFNVQDYEESFLRVTLNRALGDEIFKEDKGAIGRYLSTQYDGDLKLPSGVTIDQIMKLLDEYEAKKMSELEGEGPEL